MDFIKKTFSPLNVLAVLLVVVVGFAVADALGILNWLTAPYSTIKNKFFPAAPNANPAGAANQTGA